MSKYDAIKPAHDLDASLVQGEELKTLRCDHPNLKYTSPRCSSTTCPGTQRLLVTRACSALSFTHEARTYTQNGAPLVPAQQTASMNSLQQLQQHLRDNGVENAHLIVAIDFTAVWLVAMCTHQSSTNTHTQHAHSTRTEQRRSWKKKLWRPTPARCHGPSQSIRVGA